MEIIELNIEDAMNSELLLGHKTDVEVTIMMSQLVGARFSRELHLGIILPLRGHLMTHNMGILGT
jgi:hypothetical protein